MGDRIRELEDGLAVLQASHSSEPHPLLCEGSILVDTDKPEEQPPESEEEGADEVTKSLGTLTVSEQGISRFFGITGGSDLLLVRQTFHNSPFKIFFLPELSAEQYLSWRMMTRQGPLATQLKATAQGRHYHFIFNVSPIRSLSRRWVLSSRIST